MKRPAVTAAERTRPGGQRRIEVWADWAALGGARKVGVLSAAASRGKEVFSFEYDPAWLEGGGRSPFALDPALRLYGGPQYPAADKPNFGVFLDSAPDRWGRVLMQRREAQEAREAGRAARTLSESDFLLGVFDGYRIGGLRFKTDPDGPFVDDNRAFASPPWAALRELEHASLELERQGAEKEPGYGSWLRLLLAPGGSLGGARPKAAVVDEAGHLWIAKFPSSKDDLDVGAWEYVTHLLAVRAGLVTAPARAQRFTTSYHTFLTKRFDRTETGDRIHFASAMTLLNRTEGDSAATGASYLEMVEFLQRSGAQTTRDLETLWRRIVFFICVSNTDDHLRNHGFLLGPDGWSLSPVYDVNPVPRSDGLKLNISDVDNAQDLDLAREVAGVFRLAPGRADEVIEEVLAAVKTWRDVAHAQGIDRREQEQMEDAFRVADAT